MACHGKGVVWHDMAVIVFTFLGTVPLPVQLGKFSLFSL